MIICCICGATKPDGVRWIDVAGGDNVCSIECQKRRLLKFQECILEYIKNKGR